MRLLVRSDVVGGCGCAGNAQAQLWCIAVVVGRIECSGCIELFRWWVCIWVGLVVLLALLQEAWPHGRRGRENFAVL